MNVLFLHFDGKLPNLAGMKLAGWHRSIGDRFEYRYALTPEEVEPRFDDPVWDVVYGSLIFEWSRPLAERAVQVYPDVVLGGTGWDFVDGVQVRRTELPEGAELARPDYSDHPDVSYSIGYTQRGCRMKCEFCVVPRKEGAVRSVATLDEIWRGGDAPRHLVILDNDFFGNPNWPAIVDEAERDHFDISLIQGFNVRLLPDRAAAAVARLRLRDDQFERPRIYTAWDSLGDERVMFRGLERLVAHGVKPAHVMVYMLIGYAPGETHEDRDYRRTKLREFGCLPYPMPYVRDGELGDELVAFQRWVIQRHDFNTPWEVWWGKAKGNPRRLGSRRVSLPLFGCNICGFDPCRCEAS